MWGGGGWGQVRLDSYDKTVYGKLAHMANWLIRLTDYGKLAYGKTMRYCLIHCVIKYTED